jgi:hypothetical protein
MSYTTQIPEKLRKIRELKGYSQDAANGYESAAIPAH